MIFTYIFIQDQHFGVFCESVCEYSSIQFILKVFVFAKEEKKLQILLTSLYIVLEDDDIAQSVKATAVNPQGFIYVEVFFVVLVKDLEDCASNIDLFEVRSNIIGHCQGTQRIFFLKDLQKMRGKDYLIMAEANKKWADLFNNRDMVEIAFLFGHELFAQHCNIIYYIVLDHIEHVFLETQTIAIRYQLQRFGRVYLDCLAFSSEQILQHSDFLKILICLKGRVDETKYNIKLQITIFNLIQDQKMFIEVDQLFIFCFLDKIVNFIQIFALECSFNEQDV